MIINPELKIIIFVDKPFIIVNFKMVINANKLIAAIQKGVAIFVKNTKGIPTMVIPNIDNKDINPIQIL